MVFVDIKDMQTINSSQYCISAPSTADSRPILHRFKCKTISMPGNYNCKVCSSPLTGFIKKGVQCKDCLGYYHKECVNAVADETCNGSRKSIGSVSSSEMDTDPKEDHRFSITSFMKPTFCDYCSAMLLGLVKQGLKCNVCRETYHQKCIKHIPRRCLKIHMLNNQNSQEKESTLEDAIDGLVIEDSKSEEAISRPNKRVPVQRLSTKRNEGKEGLFWSGHMSYYTKTDPTLITRYWKLCAKYIKIFSTYRAQTQEAQITLDHIKAHKSCGHSEDMDESINEQKCYFILEVVATPQPDVYYCGLDSADATNTMNVLASNFFNMFKMAYMPFMSNKKVGRQVSWQMFKAPIYQKQTFNERYAIKYDQLLGSGQFGNVYVGMCHETKQERAIKVIVNGCLDKNNKMMRETNFFQNELTLLSSLDHPGIIKLFDLFEESDCLYIITEKLSIDMLDLIMNEEEGRLVERNAKFIIYQILNALEKLHSRQIAHCDLKPENILLVIREDRPQIKLCDFGFAKIIGEKSMRRTIVGTPAYSAPELHATKRCYNNSVDIWSMGIIMYVSLSGQFPFDDSNDISEQIKEFDEIYPDDPWLMVSDDAKDLIKLILQPRIKCRTSCKQAMKHLWFSQDERLYHDLCELESKVGTKWLVSEEQEVKWNNK